MDENEAVDEQGLGAATPIFGVYRRGYDPEQVDRYVADQQRRLDEMTHRASESERKLAAAVGQLRELHRRVAVYESEARSSQPPALDTLGEHVQRILQEAWEGAYNLRQEAEREVIELRERTQREVDTQREQALEDVEELRQVASAEAAELVDDATRRALALRDEMDRRRAVYLEKVERDRQRAVSQITYLYDQRQLALSELARLQATVGATVEEMVRSPLGKPAVAIEDSVAMRSTREEMATGMMSAPEMAGEVAVDGESIEFDLEAVLDPETDLDAGARDDDGTAAPLFVETPDARATGEYLASDPGVPSWAAEPVRAPAEDTPTGPMNAVDYGYDHSSYSNRPAHTYGTADAEGTQPGEVARDLGLAGGSRAVFDADVDGWS